VSRNVRTGIDRRALLLGMAASGLPRMAAAGLIRVAPQPFRQRLQAPSAVRIGRAEVSKATHAVWTSADDPPATLAQAFGRPESTVVLAPGVYEPATLVGITKRLIAPAEGVIVRARGPHLAGQHFDRDDMGRWHTRLHLPNDTTIIECCSPSSAPMAASGACGGGRSANGSAPEALAGISTSQSAN
jgi:hypothetical protein